MNIADAEQIVIGSVFEQPELLSKLALKPEHFATQIYQQIYEHCLQAMTDNQPVAPIEIADSVERATGQQVYTHIADVMQALVSTRQAEASAKILKRHHLSKKLNAIGQVLVKAAEQEEFSEVDHVISELMKLGQTSEKHDRSLRSGIAGALKHIEERFESKVLPGVSTGIKRLDQVLLGWQRTRLYIIPARPAMGKTALLLNMGLAATRPGLISGEQGFEEMVMRIITIDSRIDGDRIQSGKLLENDWALLTASVARLKNKNMRIYDRPGMQITEVVAKAREWKHRHAIDVLLVDYLQLIRARADSKEREVALVAEALKNIAKDLDIPVIALAQVNRECEKRPDKRPTNSDLAQSGEIEKFADVIAPLYRDEVYNPDSPDKGIAEINITKNRHGPTGLIRTAFLKRQMRFFDLDPGNYKEVAE